jgi:hypothetical protein
VTLVKIDDSKESIASIVRVERISELGTNFPEDGGDTFFRTVGYNESHGVASQKTIFFIATAVKTSNLT